MRGLCFWAPDPLINIFDYKAINQRARSPKIKATRTFMYGMIWRKSISNVPSSGTYVGTIPSVKVLQDICSWSILPTYCTKTTDQFMLENDLTHTHIIHLLYSTQHVVYMNLFVVVSCLHFRNKMFMIDEIKGWRSMKCFRIFLFFILCNFTFLPRHMWLFP